MDDSNTLTERVTPLGADAFADVVLKGSGQIVVEFMSYDCEHCRTIEPVVEEVAAQSAMRFFKINIAVDGDLADAYDVVATPTFVMFSNGKEVGRAEGPRPVFSTLAALLEQPFKP